MEPDEDLHNGDFPPTRWTLVKRAASPDDPDSFQALSELCESYWYPLYAFVRSQGAPPNDAADEVQGFFQTLLEKDFFETADEDKGKLRSFLIKGIKRYRSNEFRARNAQKRGGGKEHVSINQEWAEGRFEAEPVDDLTPEQILDRSWARLTLEQVMIKPKADFTEKGKQEEFKILNPFLAWNSGKVSHTEAAAKLGISEGNLKVKIHRMRARYRQLLDHEVRQTIDSNDQDALDEELRYLLAALG